MRKLTMVLGVSIGLVATAGCGPTVRGESLDADVPTAAAIDAADWDGSEQVIPLKRVPVNVLAAAQGAVDGIMLSRAERERERSGIVYDIVGMVNGHAYEIEVTADGHVLEIEDEDDDDDDDDDPDDDDDLDAG